jgi:peptidoglycan/LPS O-acetylase OafA/YrhL
MLRLQRITSGAKFIPEIDGLRFVAIFSVVLFHLYGSLLHNGALRSPLLAQNTFMHMISKRGVEVFFCISGFILSTPFVRARLVNSPPVNLKSYFLRRLTRLEPPYFLALFICSAAMVVARVATVRFTLPHLLASLAYIHSSLLGSNPIIGPAWSLEIEVQFYLLVPILVSIFAIRSDKVRSGSLILAVAISALAGIPLRRTVLGSSILSYASFFLAGFMVSNAYVLADGRWSERKSRAWDLVSLLGWPLVWMVGDIADHLLLPFLIPLLFVAAFRGRYSSALLSISWITDIGGMCYSIYLLHDLVIAAIGRLVKPLHFGDSFVLYFCLEAAIILPCVLCVSGTFFVLVERPCMDRRWPSKVLSIFRRKTEVPISA